MVKDITKGQNPADVKIVDFGCGTGLVGQYLKQHGFTSITGIDVSSGMLEIAAAKGCYQSLEEWTLNDPENFPAHWKSKFDVVVCAGLMNNNHLDYKIFEEMVFATK